MQAVKVLPSVAGPTATGDRFGNPFLGTPSPVGLYGPEAVELLRQYGYVEEEYFVSGIVEGEAYVTSALVRKPKDSAAFSGLVVLEPVW